MKKSNVFSRITFINKLVVIVALLMTILPLLSACSADKAKRAIKSFKATENANHLDLDISTE